MGFRKVGVLWNSSKPEGLDTARRVLSVLKSKGVSYSVDENLSDTFGEREHMDRISFSDCEMLIVLGGDGTILRALDYAIPGDLPILGVNIGRLGFLCEVERDDVEEDLCRVLDGGYAVDERMTMCIEGFDEQRFFALNEVVIDRSTPEVRILSLEYAANGTTVNHISGDGLIVATATGSTAYSLSAGGPVVEPTARNLIVSPICAHSVHANSYVLSPERTVTVQTEKTGYKPIFLSADGGRAFSLRNGDAVEIRRSKYETKLVRLSNKSFCDILQKKMLMGVLGHEE